MSAALLRTLARRAGRLCLSVIAGALITTSSAQIVPTLSPPVFSTPLYQNPFDFPGSIPLVPAIGTPTAAPTDALSPSSVAGTGNRIDASASAPAGIAGIDTLTAPISQPEISSEQLTAPRLEQLTAPELKPFTLDDQQRANPNVQQLTLPFAAPLSVGAQPLSQIRITPLVLGSQRINALSPNAIETARSRLLRQGAWSMTESRRTTPLPVKPTELPIARATALESSTYTKLDPLSPEILGSSTALSSVKPGKSIRVTAEPQSSFAFRPKITTDLHAQLPKRTQPDSLSTPAPKRSLTQPFKTIPPAQNPPATPHPGLEVPSVLHK